METNNNGRRELPDAGTSRTETYPACAAPVDPVLVESIAPDWISDSDRADYGRYWELPESENWQNWSNE